MISKWLQRLRGDSGSSATSEAEPATAPEPPSMPAEPPADTGVSTEEPAGDEPA
ncbi:MAG TPA: hypothetical protein VJ716_06180 [Gaiellaceae bacterium]|nr:hypothetical protein [Gaiellaceae bacterium]